MATYNSKSIFLIGVKISSDKVKFIGTGFFINKNGGFMSVGHNFKDYIEKREKLENYFCAFPEGPSRLYDFEFIHYKYKTPIEQKPPEYLDIAYGRIRISNVNPFLLERKKRPSKKQDLTIIGLKNMNPLPSTDPNRSFFYKPNGQFDFTNIKIKESIIIIREEYLIRPTTTLPQRFNNSFEGVYMGLGEVLKAGASGSPIYDEGNERVVGVFFGGYQDTNARYSLTSKYARKQYVKNYAILINSKIKNKK